MLSYKGGTIINKEFLKPLIRCISFGILWTILLFIIALLVVKISDCTLRDVLFVEGIVFIIIGVLSSLSGNPMGLSLQSIGQSNSQYVSNANLEITKMEKEKRNLNIRKVFGSSINMFSLVFAGIVCIVINFLL